MPVIDPNPQLTAGLAFAAQALEDEPIRPTINPSCLHKCTHYQMVFLTNADLIQYI